ncbi:uncharacterized protein LOC111342848 isoform X3 [Stylophora pistillata]|uniref:uncharacterized protein LOC111342848 isoform X3 n=1 Tax=Stylophora pistillata TaxID=50429 RepID=UPI000C049B12|nr:uncharacterized protein LOC111342848 isoform X3 [Stylophora pistillata]
MTSKCRRTKTCRTRGPKRSCSPMSKEKSPDNKELKEPHFKRVLNGTNSFGSKNKSMILNADSKENDKGCSCNAIVSPVHRSPVSSDGHKSSVHSSNHEGKNLDTALSTDSSSVAEITVSDSAGDRSVAEDYATEASLIDFDETFYSARSDTESLYHSCGRVVMDSTNSDSVVISDEDNGKEEELDDDVNESLFFTKDAYNQIHQELTVEDLENKEKSFKVLKKKEQGDDMLNERGSGKDCDSVSISPTGALTSLKSKINSVKVSNNNIFEDFMERPHTSIVGDSDYIVKFDAHVEETIVDCGSSTDSGMLPYKGADQDSSSDEGKEEEFDKDRDQFISSNNFCQEDEGTLPERSDSSDEDLLTPPRFLYEKTRLKPDICTPEKGVAPAYFTPSPVARGEGEEKTVKYKLSFDKLIADKAKHRERNAELAKMEEELQQGIDNGGIGQLPVPSTFSDIESEEELTDDGRDLRDCSLPQDFKKFLVEVHDFSEELPGEDIFPVFHPNVTSQDFPHLSMVPHPHGNSFEAKLVSASDIELQELLCGGWVLQHYLDTLCPSEVAEWLFQIMCRHTDQHIINTCFQVLWIMLEAATEDRDDIPANSRGTLWVPGIKTVLKELFSYGARIPRLYPGELVNQLNISEVLLSENSSDAIHMEEETVGGVMQTESFPLINVMHLVQLLTHSLQKCPQLYTVQDLRNLMVLMCRLALDTRLQTVVFDIEMCIAAVLSCFGETQWPDEIKELCGILTKLSTNHRNLLHLVEIQPPSTYGIELQRHLSLTLVHWLVPKFHSREEIEENPDGDRCNGTVPDNVEVASLIKLVSQIKPTDDSDYFLLHTIISLISFAVGSEDLPSKERPSLEKLTNKLRTLNGDIKDPRAAFMSRTKVKDLLVRTIFRLANMVQCIKPLKEHHIASYFEYSTSDYQVELLKENEENLEELPENDEEESMTGVQDMDSST